MTNPGEEPKDFWRDELGVIAPYNMRIDHDALAVLKGIVAGKFNSDIAKELDLPEQYVELLQTLFCSADWAEYGTSPRGCWIIPYGKGDERITEFEVGMKRRWEAP